MQSAWEQVSAPHTLSLSLSSLCGRPHEVALTCRAGCALQGGSEPCHWEGVFHQLEPIKKYRKTCLAVVVAGTVVLTISSTSLSCRGAQHDLGHATQRGGRRPGRSLCGNAAAARFGMAQWSSNRNGLKQLKASLLCCFPMLQGVRSSSTCCFLITPVITGTFRLFTRCLLRLQPSGWHLPLLQVAAKPPPLWPLPSCPRSLQTLFSQAKGSQHCPWPLTCSAWV